MNKLSHVMLSVTDVIKSVSFYEKLGFVSEYQTAEWAELKYPGIIELALKRKQPGEGDSNGGLGFTTDDCKKISDELTSYGVELFENCSLQSDGTILSKLKDQDGNVIWFAQRVK